jgi:hypothetical protein
VGAQGSGIPLPTGTPSSASGVINIAPSAGPQTLPNVGGYTASVAFPQTSASPTTMNVVSSLVLPVNIPAPFDLSTPKKKDKPRPYKALLYISMVPTKTVTFDHFPQFVFGVPQSVIDSLGDKWDLGLGFFDPTEKGKKFKLAVADRIAVATAAPTPTPSATATPTPTPTPSATPSPNPSASRTASPSPTPVPTPTIQLVAVGFGTPEMALTMEANKTYIFILYAIVSTPPSAEPSGAATSAATSEATTSATSGASANPSAGAASSSTPSPSRT